MQRTITSRILIISSVCLIFFSQAGAQPIWNANPSMKEISATYIQPTLKSLFGELKGYGLNIGAKIQLSEKKAIVLTIPYFHGKVQYSTFYIYPSSIPQTYTETHNSFGNIYVGLENHKENSSVWTNFGIFLPTSDATKILALSMGMIGDPDQYESAYPHAILLSFRVNNRYTFEPEGFGLVTRAGVSGAFRTKKEEFSPNDVFEAFLNYALQPSYSSETISFLIGFSGKLILTESGSISNRVLHQFGLSGNYTIGQFKPGAFIRIPLNTNLSNVIDNVYGFSVAAEF